MSKKKPSLTLTPTLVQERLRIWGMCVRKQRIGQGIRAADLCARLGISHPTLQRLQRGEPSVAAGVYLAALHVLGVLDMAAPGIEPALWQMAHNAPRARLAKGDDDYF